MIREKASRNRIIRSGRAEYPCEQRLHRANRLPVDEHRDQRPPQSRHRVRVGHEALAAHRGFQASTFERRVEFLQHAAACAKALPFELIFFVLVDGWSAGGAQPGAEGEISGSRSPRPPRPRRLNILCSLV
jgi:hypothetical protein